jgi:hypothetical protein
VGISARGSVVLTAVDDYILGNDLLHVRFGTAIKIVVKIAAAFPDSVAVDALEQLTGLAAENIDILCTRLAHAGLLQSDRLKVDAWLLGCDPVQTTLEEVFRCLLAEQLDGSRRASAAVLAPSRPQRDVDLLLMQVAMTINQSAFKHLRLFSLDRLTVGAAQAVA